MDNIEYTKRLEDICEELLTIDWGDDRNAYYSYLTEAITEIKQLNNEAIGEDSYWYVDDNGVKQYNTFNGTANGVKRELRAVIGLIK